VTAGGPGDFAEARLRQSVAAWLRAALTGPDGRQWISYTKLSKDAKVGRTTIHNLLKGQQDAEEETLARLAKALKVGAPVIVRVLDTEPGQPPTPLAMLREAETLLRRGLQALQSELPSPAADASARTALDAQVARHHRQVQADKARSAPPQRRRLPKTGSG
jgi:transcriptional regulator with XRE-family HTH domain